MEIAARAGLRRIADHQSFSEAAETLFWTQPAVGKRVAPLETELDTRLFDRIGRRVSLTATGAAPAATARRLDQRCPGAEAGSQRIMSGEVAGRTGFMVCASRALKTLHRTVPRVDGYPFLWILEAACRAVETGDPELAIVTLPPTTPLPTLQLQTIWDDPLAFMVGLRDHPLADREQVSLQELIIYPAVLPRHHDPHQRDPRRCRAHRRRRTEGGDGNELPGDTALRWWPQAWRCRQPCLTRKCTKCVDGFALSRRFGAVTTGNAALPNAGTGDDWSAWGLNR